MIEATLALSASTVEDDLPLLNLTLRYFFQFVVNSTAPLTYSKLQQLQPFFKVPVNVDRTFFFPNVATFL